MLTFLGDAYSVAYGLVNSMVLRLMFPGAVCLAYLVFEIGDVPLFVENRLAGVLSF